MLSSTYSSMGYAYFPFIELILGRKNPLGVNLNGCSFPTLFSARFSLQIFESYCEGNGDIY